MKNRSFVKTNLLQFYVANQVAAKSEAMLRLSELMNNPHASAYFKALRTNIGELRFKK